MKSLWIRDNQSQEESQKEMKREIQLKDLSLLGKKRRREEKGIVKKK